MRIIQTIAGWSERTVVYESGGERKSLTRPACVTFEEMYKEIEQEEKVDKNDEPEETEGNEEEGKTNEEVPVVTEPEAEPVPKKRTKRKA